MISQSLLFFEVMTSKTVPAEQIEGVMALENTTQKKPAEPVWRKLQLRRRGFEGVMLVISGCSRQHSHPDAVQTQINLAILQFETKLITCKMIILKKFIWM